MLDLLPDAEITPRLPSCRNGRSVPKCLLSLVPRTTTSCISSLLRRSRSHPILRRFPQLLGSFRCRLAPISAPGLGRPSLFRSWCLLQFIQRRHLLVSKIVHASCRCSRTAFWDEDSLT